MPSRGKNPRAVRHGTRKLLLQALDSTQTGPTLATSKLFTEVRRLSGQRIPEDTIRGALRNLVKTGIVRGRRAGREKVYKLVHREPNPDTKTGRSNQTGLPQSKRRVAPARAPIPERPKVPKRSPRMVPHTEFIEQVSSPEEPTPALVAPAGPIPPSQAPSGPHKLAVGEALVLHVGENHVETATNVHGKIVLERHARPKA